MGGREDKERWEMKLYYKHIKRVVDVNLMGDWVVDNVFVMRKQSDFLRLWEENFDWRVFFIFEYSEEIRR